MKLGFYLVFDVLIKTLKEKAPELELLELFLNS